MDDYISREAAEKILYDGCHTTDGREILDDVVELWHMIQNLPAADVQPVRHGRNICNTVPEHCEFKCSLCGAELSTVYGGRNDFGMDGGYLKYCPNCGARMDGGEP